MQPVRTQHLHHLITLLFPLTKQQLLPLQSHKLLVPVLLWGSTANIINGGASPSYSSFTGIGTASNFSGSNFTLVNAANGAQVQCRLTSNAACVNPVQVSSSPIIINCINNCTSVSPATLNFQVYPNPARQDAIISFTLCTSVRISLDVFNIAGQKITILEDKALNSGNLTIPWNTNKVAAGSILSGSKQ